MLRNGLSEPYGSWKTGCMRLRRLNSSLPVTRREVLAVDDDLAARGVLELQQHLRDGRLARARLAHERHGGALRDLERDVVDRGEARPTPRILKTLVRFSTTIAGGCDAAASSASARASAVAIRSIVSPAADDASAAIDDSAAAMLPVAWMRRRREARRRGDETLRVRVLRVLRGSRPTDPDSTISALVHHDELLGALGGEAEVVRDEQQRRAELARERLEVVEDDPLHRDVERRGRLVGDEQLRVRREADADEHALAHAARELVRELLQSPVGIVQAGLLQHLDRRAS